MNAYTGKFIKLSDTEETVANQDEDIRDRHVRDRNGDDIGKVKDLILDETERKVRFLEVASGGFLGIGQDTTFIPVDAITAIAEDEVRIDTTREHVAGAPTYDPELVHEPDTYSPLFGYYGYDNPWNPGYQYPRYPYYSTD